MKHIALILLLISTLCLKAEYGGIHFELSIEMLDGKKIHGYRYLAHADDSEESKMELIKEPERLLQNQFTDQPGPYNIYLNRLEYSFDENNKVFHLLDPVRIVLDSIKSMKILSTVYGSYAIGLAGDYKIEDQDWMNTEPIAKYSEGEDMCLDDIYIHQDGSVLPGVLIELKRIIKSYDNKIKARIAKNESELEDDLAYDMLIKDLVEDRRKELEPFLYIGSGLKAVVVRMCTC